jgi:hypothetical protein
VKRAILQLQRALRRRYGKAYTDSGGATLSISNDRIELTNEECTIVARGPVKVVRVLRRRRRK